MENQETKAVRFHEACSSELNEKLNVLKFSESMKIMKNSVDESKQCNEL